MNSSRGAGWASRICISPAKTTSRGGKTHTLRDLRLAVPFLSNLASKREVHTEPLLAFNLNGSAFTSAARSTLAAPEPKMPTPQEFEVGVQVTATQCTDQGVCTYTYSIQPNYVGFHPLPERDFAVFYEIEGGTAPQPGNFTVSSGQARVYKDVTVEGPPGAQLTARVTGISPVAGPKPLPGPGAKTEDVSPQPIS